jgi:hypothetical protein
VYVGGGESGERRVVWGEQEKCPRRTPTVSPRARAPCCIPPPTLPPPPGRLTGGLVAHHLVLAAVQDARLERLHGRRVAQLAQHVRNLRRVREIEGEGGGRWCCGVWVRATWCEGRDSQGGVPSPLSSLRPAHLVAEQRRRVVEAGAQRQHRRLGAVVAQGEHRLVPLKQRQALVRQLYGRRGRAGERVDGGEATVSGQRPRGNKTPP